MDGVSQRQRDAALRGFDVVDPNILEALRIGTKPDAPLGLDRTSRTVLDQFDNRLPFPAGNHIERIIGGRGSPRIAVSIEGHVRKAAVSRDGWWLPVRELEGRHIS